MRSLRIAFDTPEAFEREYVSNLVNAGIFIATAEPFELREAVEVDIALEFAGRSVSLAGEVVHIVDAKVASTTEGGTPGVAVQFTTPAHEVRERLAPLIKVSGAFHKEPQDPGKRSSPRVPARVVAVVAGPDGPVRGATRNLSRSGVLVDVFGTEIPIGASVGVTLIHPVTGRAMEVPARVAREVRNEDEIMGLGIHFEPPEAEKEEFFRFVEEIQSSEHTRRLGGISGSIAELGPQSLLQMFGTSAKQGTLRLVQGEQEGLIGFERGLLRYARLGGTSGMKALIRLLAWSKGGFEFNARLDPVETPEPPLPLEAAVLEAVRQLDELARIDTTRFAPRSKLRLAAPDASADDPTKVEEAVLDLARAGFNVARVLDVIPEPDLEIYRAMKSLVDQGVVTCDG